MTPAEYFARVEEEIQEIKLLLLAQTDEVLRIEGACELTGLSRSAIYQKTCSQNGQPPELKFYKRGKRIYFRRSDLVQWMTQHQVSSRREIDERAVNLTRKPRHIGGHHA